MLTVEERQEIEAELARYATLACYSTRYAAGTAWPPGNSTFAGAEGPHPPIVNLSAANSGELLAFRRVYSNLDGVRGLHDVPSFCHFVCCAVSHK
jgi:hypothetical protein